MIMNIYPYGSRVYGTADEKSDTDLILVADSADEPDAQIHWSGVDLTIWTAAEFQWLLNEHDPAALECWFLPNDMAVRSSEFEFKLDLSKLRRSFSAKSSNSWVKAKKKIEVHNEFRLGLKSLFHSLRILDFGLQIANTGKIVDYSASNDRWRTILQQRDGVAGWNRCFTSWQCYKEYWQPHYNRLRTEFRLVAPLAEGEKE